MVLSSDLGITVVIPGEKLSKHLREKPVRSASSDSGITVEGEVILKEKPFE